MWNGPRWKSTGIGFKSPDRNVAGLADGLTPDRFVTVERRPDGVALLRLDRPKMNALSGALLAQLAEEADRLAADPPGAVVVWGGPRIFAAGADVSEFV